MTRNWVPTSLELNPIRAAAYPKDPRDFRRAGRGNMDFPTAGGLQC